MPQGQLFSSRCGRDVSGASSIPAVFPFPEPIPREPPRATPSETESLPRPPRPPRTPTASKPKGADMKSESKEAAFMAQNKQRANGWIAACAPRGSLLNHAVPVWLQLKRDAMTTLKHREEAFRKMPTLPFNVWLERQRELQAAQLRFGQAKPQNFHQALRDRFTPSRLA